ncbi:hypothetical protein RJ639_043127 [Escallonia herrerae]|uniref:Co-chaperone protein p23 n=1 Tax=Escallonia herrerae TaxID=1293975 RepID=A0AA89B9S3_9ASTE|nr:hypothetical protein RJ639_043127 [Escallonia herrerae]
MQLCSLHPEVLWAQRSDKIYLTIALPDAKDVSVKCQSQGLLSFSAMGKQGEYFDFSLELYGKIVPERCKTNIGLRNTICSIQKGERGWWTRLLKPEEKPAPYLKVDWNKWCDEDEESTHCKLVQHIIADLPSDDDLAYTGEDDRSSDDEGMLLFRSVSCAMVVLPQWKEVAYFGKNQKEKTRKERVSCSANEDAK